MTNKNEVVHLCIARGNPLKMNKKYEIAVTRRDLTGDETFDLRVLTFSQSALWMSCFMSPCTIEELKKRYNEIMDMGLNRYSYTEEFIPLYNHMVLDGLIAYGKGNTKPTALFDMFSRAYLYNVADDFTKVEAWAHTINANFELFKAYSVLKRKDDNSNIPALYYQTIVKEPEISKLSVSENALSIRQMLEMESWTVAEIARIFDRGYSSYATKDMVEHKERIIEEYGEDCLEEGFYDDTNEEFSDGTGIDIEALMNTYRNTATGETVGLACNELIKHRMIIPM